MSKIRIVMEPPSDEAYKAGRAIEPHIAKMLREHMEKAGFRWDQFAFTSLCPPIPETVKGSAKREKAYLAPFVEALHKKLDESEPAVCYLGLGKHAWQALTQSNDSIMKQAGVGRRDEKGRMLFALLGPRQVAIDPSFRYRLDADLAALKRLHDAGWDYDKVQAQGGNYRWVDDLQFLIDMKPAELAFDTEGSGLRWYAQDYTMYVLQLCWAPGEAVAIPGPAYWDRWRAEFDAMGLDYSKLEKVWTQAAEIMADKRIRKCGHNVKYDMHCVEEYLGVKPLGVETENMILINHIDEEMRQKGLKPATTRWIPEMAGYSQKFDIETVKSAMLEVHPNDMLMYGCGDADSTMRLKRTLTDELKKDQQQYSVYSRIPQPGVLAAYEMEKVGIPVSKDRLKAFGRKLQEMEQYERSWLLRFTPTAVKRKHMREQQEKLGKHYTDLQAMSFTRPAFTRDIFFSGEGFNLTPRLWTKSTKALPEDQRIPSISAKQHLVYFFKDTTVIGHDGEKDVTVGQYCMHFTKLAKVMKMLGTYAGDPGDEDDEEAGEPVTGIWKYLDHNSRLHPTFKGWGTVTQRLATSDPNSTNWPTRDPDLSKPFLSCFTAPEGQVYVAADNSQVELRLIAWMANERVMRRIYRDGGDIHTVTAMAILGITPEQWEKLSKAEKKLRRTQAKAVNFGFCFGMLAKKFQVYAFTDYGVELTLDEAEKFRTIFFRTYPALEDWHRMMIEEARTFGQVRALHGLCRHLNGIKSADKFKQGDAERQGINSPIQGFASQIGQAGHTRLIAQRQSWLQVNNFIHDANYALVDRGHERDGVEGLVYSMQSVPLKEWFDIVPPIPLVAEPDIGISLGEKFELNEVRAVWQKAGKPALHTLKDDKGNRMFPDWLEDIQDRTNILEYDASVAPVWWNPDIDRMGVEAFW